MNEISAIAAALASFNAAKDIAQAMIGLRDSAAFQSKMIEFQSAILDAQNAAFSANDERTALIQRVRDLEEQMTHFEEWEREKKRYELKRLPPSALVYALKDEAASTEAPHYLCANCFEQRKKSYLQSDGPFQGTERFHCNTCGEKIRTGTPARPTVQNTRRPDVI